MQHKAESVFFVGYLYLQFKTCALIVLDDSKFSEAITVLLTWIERGEVNRRSANQFYSMVQSANSHVRRLMNEKAAHEQEMEQAKESFKNALTGILTQFEQIVAVFNASTRQKAWDHFSKAQRKNIDIWRKHSEELRNAHSEQLMGIRREEEMEMSDDDSGDNPSKKLRVDDSVLCDAPLIPTTPAAVRDGSQHQGKGRNTWCLQRNIGKMERRSQSHRPSPSSATEFMPGQINACIVSQYLAEARILPLIPPLPVLSAWMINTSE
uniref:Ecto-NOX disulfide-thiol exchanger 1 n=1 Tax=Meleagris gallopavo TaxID=9103 RepID=A0A803Y8J4_MELGA